MNAKSKHSLNALNGKRQAKDTKNQRFAVQMKRVYKAFSERPKTMKQASIETGVMRANICRYVAKWRKADKIGVAFYGVCPITKYRHVTFFTTDPKQFIKPKNKK